MMRYLAVTVVVLAVVGVGWVVGTRELAAPLPDSVVLDEVSGQPQSRNLSCESRSAADLAAFWGVPVQESEFLERLPRSDNPHEGFVGSPDDRWGQLPPRGYGVYAEPVAALLREYGLPARAEYRRGLAWLRQQLAANRPVIIWATYEFEPRPVVSLQDSDGEQFKAVPFEHTYLVVGYTPDGFEVIDPLDGRRKSVPVDRFQAAWAALDEMAVVATDPRAAARDPGAFVQALQTYGLPFLSAFFLMMAFVTWRMGASGREGRKSRKSRRSRSGSGSARPGRPRPGTQMLEQAVEALRPGRRPSGRGADSYRLAKSLGLVFLLVGLLLAFKLGGFNPFLGIPLFLACGAAGYLVGYIIENWGRG